MDFSRYFRDYPTVDGRFGPYGGAYISDELKEAMHEISTAYFTIAQSRQFIAELRRIRLGAVRKHRTGKVQHLLLKIQLHIHPSARPAPRSFPN